MFISQRPLNRLPLSAARRSGFTLIELMLVMVILAILAAVVVPKLAGRSEQARVAAAKADIATLSTQVKAFEIDNGRYPSAEEGLGALVNKPGGELPNWKQLLDSLPTDPWGHPYVYHCPGASKDFDLFSCGPDGREGTDDDVH